MENLSGSKWYKFWLWSRSCFLRVYLGFHCFELFFGDELCFFFPFFFRIRTLWQSLSANSVGFHFFFISHFVLFLFFKIKLQLFPFEMIWIFNLRLPFLFSLLSNSRKVKLIWWFIYSKNSIVPSFARKSEWIAFGATRVPHWLQRNIPGRAQRVSLVLQLQIR